MPLPHFTQLQGVGSPGGPGTLPDEVVYLNLFEITFILPVILQAQGRDPILLLQNATKIDLNLTEFDITSKHLNKFLPIINFLALNIIRIYFCFEDF